LVHLGAEFVVQPTAWVNASGEAGAFANIQPEFLVRARALEFGVPVASCSKSGRETSAMGYVGLSMVVDSCGNTLAQAPIEGDTAIVADIAPCRAKQMELDAEMRAALRCRPEPVERVEDALCVKLRGGESIDRCGSLLRAEGVRVVRLDSAGLSTFPLARIQALRGAQVILVGPPRIETALLRARAAENRIYIIVFDDGGLQCVIEPTGQVVAARATGFDCVSIRPADADLKQFTLRTPIWSQRRVAEYPFM
jgi:predicted amidohydrolase